MDLTSFAAATAAVAATVAVPIASMLAKSALNLANRRLHLDLSAQTDAAIERGVQAGAGMLTARLASGKMDLSHVSLGNQHVDDAVVVGLNVAGAAAVEAGLTRETMAASIVGVVGKALGQDPTVPTVPISPAARSAAAATASPAATAPVPVPAAAT